MNKERFQTMKKIELDDCTDKIVCGVEFENPDDHYKSGNPEQDAEDVAKIRRDLENGNQWAWCAVEVVVNFHGLTAIRGLGCCSYDSEQQFKSGYYNDMVAECVDELNVQAENLNTLLNV